MSVGKKSPILSVRLGPELKDRWEAYCESLGRAPSSAIKEAIEQQLKSADALPAPRVYRQTEAAKEPKQRFELLLTASEKAAVKERSHVEHCSMRRWVVDAIRTGLTHEPQFGMSEIYALGESNYQLLALGRNLNQVARRLNEGTYEPITVERIEALSRLINEHTKVVSDAIRASLERWSITRET
ncbi:plasmid mobilization relaxosome protein MobC [Pseudomonas syringae]|uniref:plasmid mobilization relaxosome protein MobC n=1 Tax=Pseudomonas syringae TaxID=317 RepID=UPI000BB5C7D3|nr:plasmid mobilization relaxosome protein MobC [Pseudomonas syringae]PBQ06548.1 plasmid mobilization relaxosome protein MobC [Pseudomonas syringae]